MQQKITFRLGGRISDAKDIERIMRSSGFFEEVSSEIECALDDLNEHLKNSSGTYLFAEIENRVVGYVSFDSVPCSDSAFEFEWIAVDNGLRGMGIGKKLMEKSFEIMRSQGGRKAFLQTSGRPQYLPTRKFYEKCGFRHEATLEDYYIVGDPCFFYSILL